MIPFSTIKNKQQLIAIIGASNNKEKYGNTIYNDLKQAGYRVVAINPTSSHVEGDRAYASVLELQEVPVLADIVTPPLVTEHVVKECFKKGIRTVWMQPGAQSDKAIQYCKDNHIKVIHDACIMVEKA